MLIFNENKNKLNPNGVLKIQDQKMQDLKMQEQIAGVENAGPENGGLSVNAANR